MGLQRFDVTGSQESCAPSDTRYFTVAEANAALPLVERVVRDIVAQYHLVMQHHAALQARNLSEGDLERVDSARLEATDRLNELVCELSDIGCELKDWDSGLVDFPARLEGRDICLCWRLGETVVAHWHEVHAGFAGRTAIAQTDGLQ